MKFFNELKVSLEEAVELTHLEDLEDYYLAADISARITRGEESTHSTNEVRAALGLDD